MRSEKKRKFLKEPAVGQWVLHPSTDVNRSQVMKKEKAEFYKALKVDEASRINK